MTSCEKFYECFYKIVNEKNNNSVYLSAVKYNEIVSEIKNVRSSGIKSNKAYRILKRYDLITIGEEDKLILPLLEGIQTFCTILLMKISMMCYTMYI